jgi:hypothetical protein
MLALSSAVNEFAREPERNEGELDLARLEQLDVLGWSFGRPCENRDIDLRVSSFARPSPYS